MSKKSLIGLPIAKHYVTLSDKKVLDKRTGFVLPIERIVRFDEKDEPTVVAPPPAVKEIKREVEIVAGVGRQRINLKLATSSGEVPAQNGFLIEVFESGSDGKLTRLYSEDLIDELSEDVIREGFQHYLTLKVDD
jgi:hypothetical protein